MINVFSFRAVFRQNDEKDAMNVLTCEQLFVEVGSVH